MARIRTIKPDFWLDEDLAELPAETRLLAIGLLNHSDDEGYFRANPKIVKAAVFPFTEDSVSIHGMLKQLQKVGYVRLGTGSDGKAYGQVTNFSKHQKVNRPNESKIKELEPFTEHSVSDQGDGSEDSLPEGKGREGKNTVEFVSRETRLQWFETLWSTFDSGLGAKGAKKTALAQWEKLKPDKAQFETILSALQSQVASKTEFKDRQQFYENFPHVERWLKYERWNDEIAETEGGGESLTDLNERFAL